jgi:glycosyltransferase involved in cell wall biosynthesis
MTVRIGINGFGRIGRALLRVAIGRPDLDLTIVGNEQLSEPEVSEEVRRRIGAAPLVGHVVFAGQLDDRALAHLYARADVLVMPSYHEGYCVPVIEAMAAGAYVVAYDAANLPFILDGLGSLVPEGDVAALSAALVELAGRFRVARQEGGEVVLPATRGDLAEPAWRAEVAEHVAQHSYPAYRRRLVDLLAALTARRPQGAPAWLAEAAGTVVPA